MVCLQNALTSVNPPGETPLLPLLDIVSALQDCRKSKDVERGKRLHLQLCHHGLEAHELLGNHIVPLLSECGCLQDAQNTFNKLRFRNEHAWTSLMQGYLDAEEPELAFSLYCQMQDDCVLPTEYTFVPLLKSCCNLICNRRGNVLHSDIILRGYDSDIVLGNSLLDLYVKCYTLEDAHRVFDLLPYRDVFSWNTLITGYAEQGDSQKVLTVYKKMLLVGGGLQPDACTFVCILNSCSTSSDVHLGQEIHGEIIKEGYEECTYVASKLVDFYAQCGFLKEAQDVFDQLSGKDKVTWTALIAGYAEHGPTENALICYEHMQSVGMTPDRVTLVCVLKACGCPETIDKGRKLHSQIVKQEECCDPFLGNSLVCMYAKCGIMLDSKKVFDMLQQRDVVSWTALITGYVECGCSHEALASFERMQYEGVLPNAATFTCIMQVFSNTCTLGKGQEVFNEIVKKGFETDISICHMVLNLYINLGFLEEAQALFDAFGVLDLSTWNLLIAGFAERGFGEEVFACVERMYLQALSPNATTYSCCLSSCTNSMDVMKGFILHSEVLKKGFEKEDCVGGALLELYAMCSSLADLENVFHNLFKRDVTLWNGLIQGYVHHGLVEKAFSCLELMYTEGVLPDVVSWNTLVLGFAEAGQSVKSLELFLLMQAHSLSPDRVMLVSTLKVCGELAALEFGKRVHAQSCQLMEKENYELCNTLIDMYGKCGNMSLAQVVFDSMTLKNLVTWNALLAGYARHGASTLVFHYSDKMKECYVEPDEVTFLSVLNACRHAGLLSRGQEWFEERAMKYGLSLNVKHYTCMIDQYGRAGHVNEVILMLDKMPLHPDLVMWEMVLGSCHKQGNAGVGRKAFNSLARLDESHSTAFVLLSNMYVNAFGEENF